jgi:hypothetical protein
MIADVVHWADGAKGCSRCGRDADYYVPPYWRPHRKLCPTCCVELDRLYATVGWPRGVSWP